MLCCLTLHASPMNYLPSILITNRILPQIFHLLLTWTHTFITSHITTISLFLTLAFSSYFSGPGKSTLSLSSERILEASHLCVVVLTKLRYIISLSLPGTGFANPYAFGVSLANLCGSTSGLSARPVCVTGLLISQNKFINWQTCHYTRVRTSLHN